jgi:hypothetical protein
MARRLLTPHRSCLLLVCWSRHGDTGRGRSVTARQIFSSAGPSATPGSPTPARRPRTPRSSTSSAPAAATATTAIPDPYPAPQPPADPPTALTLESAGPPRSTADSRAWAHNQRADAGAAEHFKVVTVSGQSDHGPQLRRRLARRVFPAGRPRRTLTNETELRQAGSAGNPVHGGRPTRVRGAS